MDGKKYSKFYVDWLNIRRSTIYGAIAIIVVVASVVVGLSWASRNDSFAAADGTLKLQVVSSSSEAIFEFSDDQGNRGGYTVSPRRGRASRR